MSISSNKFHDWCQQQNRPFVCIRPYNKDEAYNTVVCDFICVPYSDGFSEEASGLVEVAIDDCNPKKKDLNSIGGVYTHAFVPKDRAVPLAKRLIELALEDIERVEIAREESYQDAVKNGLVVLPKYGSYKTEIMFHDWCEQQNRPFVCVMPFRKDEPYSIVECDFSCVSGSEGFSEEAIPLVEALVNEWNPEIEDWECTEGLYTYVAVLKDNAVPMAKKMLELALDDIARSKDRTAQVVD